MHSGYATAAGTARFAARFPHPLANAFFRTAQGLTVSSLGLGSYLGAIDEATDASYAVSMVTAARSGINFIDTSLNYRNQHSELAIGGAIDALLMSGQAQRDELVVCTKAGYLVSDAVPLAVLHAKDIVGNMHTMAPEFLDDQLERSRKNLNLATIDVFYLHNPETQLRFISSDVFYHRIALAFERMEQLVSDGRIRYYGAATWDGFRRNGRADGLSLIKLAWLAEQIGGADHHFRFIQLPFNLGMVEAFGQRAEERDGVKKSVLDAAADLGITVIASATLQQARLTKDLPGQVMQSLRAQPTDACRAIQFTRSAPGISTALVGMSKPEHVDENIQVAHSAPLSAEDFGRLFAK